jgi:hypothetical protein
MKLDSTFIDFALAIDRTTYAGPRTAPQLREPTRTPGRRRRRNRNARDCDLIDGMAAGFGFPANMAAHRVRGARVFRFPELPDAASRGAHPKPWEAGFVRRLLPRRPCQRAAAT